MKKVYFIFITFLDIMIGCSRDSQTSFIVINANGLKKSGEGFNKMLFITEKDGYLFGDASGKVVWKDDGLAERTDTAVVYNTKDGGLTWNRQTLGEGKIINATLLGGVFYNTKFREGINPVSTIYKMGKEDNQWERLIDINGFIRDFSPSHKGHFFITKVDERNKYSLYETADTGRNWYKHDSVKSIYQPIFKEKAILYLTSVHSETPAYYDTFVMYDPIARKKKTVPLPQNFTAYLMNEYEGDIYFLGTENDSEKVVLYRYTTEGEFDLINYISGEGRIFPKSLHIYGDQIVILIGKRKSLYIENSLYQSFDQGRNFKQKDLENSLYVGSIAYYDIPETKNVITLIYCGNGKLQKLSE